MKKVILFLLLLISAVSFSQGTLVEENSQVFSDPKYKCYGFVPDSLEKTVLNEAEFGLADRILSQSISSNKNGNDIMKIGDMLYVYQLFPYLNSAGEKMVWVNAVSKDFVEGIDDLSWREECIIVFDGWNSFWNVHLNLTKVTSRDLYVNGI